MSRAFVKEDAGWGDPGKRYALPARTDPGYDQAAAEALLEGARSGDTGSAESATGYYWGEKKLRPLSKPFAREPSRMEMNDSRSSPIGFCASRRYLPTG